MEVLHGARKTGGGRKQFIRMHFWVYSRYRHVNKCSRPNISSRSTSGCQAVVAAGGGARSAQDIGGARRLTYSLVFYNFYEQPTKSS